MNTDIDRVRAIKHKRNTAGIGLSLFARILTKCLLELIKKISKKH